MIELEERTHVDASPEEVFDYIADPHNHPKFMPSLMEITDVDENEVGKEGRFVFKMVGTSLEGRFVDEEFDRPSLRTYDLRGDIDGRVTWTVEEADEGAEVRYESPLEPPGPDLLGPVTEPIMERYLQSEAESTLKNLKALVEA